MDKREYRRKYYQANKQKLQAYQKWYYLKKKKERENAEIEIKSKIREKPFFKKLYGDFTIHFE